MSCDSSSTSPNNCDKTNNNNNNNTNNSTNTTNNTNKESTSTTKNTAIRRASETSEQSATGRVKEEETTKSSEPVCGGGGGDTAVVVVVSPSASAAADNMMLATSMQPTTVMSDSSTSQSSSTSSASAVAAAAAVAAAVVSSTSSSSVNNSTSSGASTGRKEGRSSASGASGGRSMQHPNIHHHPVIRPHHNRYHQRAMSSSGSSGATAQTPTSPNLTTSSTTAAISSISSGAIDEMSSNKQKTASNNSPTLIEPSSSLSPPSSPLVVGSQSHLNIADPVFNRDELKKTEEEIVAMQDLINKLNNEIFKDPQNHIRPPSEYLEVYNRFTMLLHCMQKRKETLEQEIKHSQEKSNSIQATRSNNDSNSSLFESATSPLPQPCEIIPYSSSPPPQQSQSNRDEDPLAAASGNESSAPSSSSPPGSLAFLSSSPSKQHHSMLNDAAEQLEATYRKPPLPKNALPKVRLEHPTTLMTNTTTTNTSPPTSSKQQQQQQTKLKQQVTTPNLPITNRAINVGANNQLPSTIISSASTSPATTPTFPNYYYANKQQQQQLQQQSSQAPPYETASSSSPPPNHLSTSTSSISLPLAANAVPSQQYSQQQQQQQQYQIHLNSNGLISYNRSFGDISEMASMISSSSATAVTATTPTTSLSPSASSATTPTYNPLPSSSFLRVFIGTSTAVVEKKPIMLKDALYSKLKSRNLDIEKCIAYIKDSNIKIEWELEVNKLNADHIVVAEISDQIRHSFEKKTFTLRSCDSCKKRFLLNVYVCSKCDYVMCQRNECRARSERIVCAQRRVTSIEANSAKSSSTLNKPEFDIFGRPESPETSINISQQILPVNQLKVNPTSRDRSRSETELNMFVNPKLTNDTTRPVPKSPSTLAKSNINKNSIYNTIPRKPIIIKPNNLDSDISGSVNEGSGSVITSIDKVASGIHLKPEVSSKTEKVIKQSKPFRRDSFNSWEIPFTQIKIDMNKKVGSGSFGIVHQGRDFYHGTVAIKFLNVQNPTPSQAQAFRNEVAILKSLRHDCILLFIGCILKPYLAIVTEWCPGSSLYRHLHVQEEHWDVNQLIEIAKQTAIGMEYLHARNILHRDLKSNNIFLIPKEINPTQTSVHSRNANNRNRLLNEFLSTSPGSQFEPKWLVKIGDFGLATVKSAAWNQDGSSQALSPAAARTNQPTGSILWMAPEVITQKVVDPYTPKSDVYSYGVVLYELLTGQLPYSHKEQNTILFMVGSGRLKPNPDDLREDTPSDVKDLMVACCQYDRNKRVDFVEINDRLRKTKMVKSKLNRVQRSQSLPCLSFVPAQNLYDDELYPSTPHPDMLSTNNNRMMNLNEFVDSQDILNDNPDDPSAIDGGGLNNASSQTSIINL